MPELPEVQTITDDLNKVLTGKKFLSIETEVPDSIYPSMDFFKYIKGKKILSIKRRGKYISIFFENDFVLTIHLRMSGRLLISRDSYGGINYVRTVFKFDGIYLNFADMRKFGRIWLSRSEDYENDTGISGLGIEPFDEKFNFEYFTGIIGQKKGSVKKNLLDQSLIAGIGNIYADEALFYSGILPSREIKSLKKNELLSLYNGILKSLNQGLRNRGTSFSDFHDTRGKKGTNQETLFVYGRAGKKCLNCESQIIKTKVAGRGTAFCQICQK